MSNIVRGTRVRPKTGSATAGILGERVGVVDNCGIDTAGEDCVWVLLDDGGYVQGNVETEWDVATDL